MTMPIGNANDGPMSLGRRSLLGAAGAGLLASAIASRPAAAAEAVQLTVWSWTPHTQDEIALFEQSHPNIKVQLVNVGQGAVHYQKMRTALKAGTGLPDVAQVSNHMIPSFQLVDALVDLAPYGADKIGGDYVPWVWQQVSRNGRVYGIPWDTGPVALLYREDILDKYKITPPATWDEFADSALRLREETPDVFLTDLTMNNDTWMSGWFWQAGWNPFHVEGTTISIAVNDAAARKVAAFWQKLIDSGAVEAQPGGTPEWYTAYDRGRYATWFIAAWGPVFLAQFAKSSAGYWRAAPPPVWDPGKFVSGNMGGSTLAVMKQSPHPKEAAELVMWLLHDPASTSMFAEKQFLFPTLTSLMDSPGYADATNPFYGDEQIHKIFIDSAKHVDHVVEWSPFQDYAYAVLVTEMSAAASGKGTLMRALDRVQDHLVAYAREQGFTVKA
jgi:multiple sugar transport system substrate-binding protein